MRVLFLDPRPETVGSARIYIHNLATWLGEVGCETAVNDACPAGYDVIVVGKGASNLERVAAAARANPDAVIGWVQGSGETARWSRQARRCFERVDFLLAGSLEERDYRLRFGKEVFVFPLIERMYTRLKEHADVSPVTLGYHGNAFHLTEFYPALTGALESLARELPVRLLAIYNKPHPDWEWRMGRPSIDVEEIEWTAEGVEDELLRCDIGLVPYMTPIRPGTRRELLDRWDDRIDGQRVWATDHDHLFRVKHNSNPGRAFVFHQLHIPVVADMAAPSHFHVMGDPRCGCLAHTTEGWLDGLRRLCASSSERARVATAARQRFVQLYDARAWALELVARIDALRQCRRRPRLRRFLNRR